MAASNRVEPKQAFVSKVPHLEPIVRVKKICKFVGAFSGMLIMDEDFQFTFLTGVTCAVIVVAISFSSYTTWQLRHSLDLMTGLISMGISIPGAFKQYYGLKYSGLYRSMLKFGEDLYVYNSSRHRAAKLLAVAQRTHRTAMMTMVISLLGIAAFAAVPVYDFLVLGDLHLFLTIHIPGVDTEQSIGFAVTMLMQVVLSFYGVLGSLHFDLVMLLMVLNYRAIVVVLQFKMDDFDDNYARSCAAKPSRGELALRRAILRNLLLQFSDTNRYVISLSEGLGNCIDIQVIMSTFAIVIALFAAVASDYRAGYGVGVFMLTEILIQCYLGMALVTEKENMCRMVYAMSWYNYDVIDQKTFGMLLQMCQNMDELSIANLLPLNLETGSDIVRFIYKYYAMILEFIE